MWDSFVNSCDTCQYSRKEKSLEDNEDVFFNKDSLSPVKNEDLSLYGETTSHPVSCAIESSPHCPTRRSLYDIDATSQDSGYETVFQGENGKLLSYTSPNRELSRSFESESIYSIEDDFLEDFAEIEPLEEPSVLPKDFSKLISNPLVIKSNSKQEFSPRDTVIRPLFRRALSLQNPTPNSKNSKVRTNLFSLDIQDDKENRISAKRPDPPTNFDNMVVKKSKLLKEITSQTQSSGSSKPFFQRQFSATEESIMCAVQKSSTEPDLIGDFSKNYCLPLTIGKHQDLKAITADTLAKVMRGEFSHTVASFKVIDCRYPYEFLGGHISDAINLYTKEQISELLHENQVPLSSSFKRHILVFHCEFSSKRGPDLYRYLRKEDRTRNIGDYPLLNYPEIYLLEGGYKNFFQQFPEMCVPEAYKEMLHPDHEEELRHFRQKSKTWNPENRQKSGKSLKKL